VSNWLAPAFGGDLELRPDLDQVEAFASERDALWSRLQGVTFLTDDEKRAAAGYGAPLDAPGDSPSSSLPPGAETEVAERGAGPFDGAIKYRPD